MTLWNDIVLGMSFILLLFLVWKEVRRPDRRWLAARVIASGLAVIALACLGLPLTRDRRTALPPPPVLPTRSPWGIVSIDWTRKLVKGDPLRVEGRWVHRAGQDGRKTKLILAGMGSVLDSVEIPEGANEFSLSAVPAVIGRAVYHFIVLTGSDTLEREEIPVEVVAGKPLNILFLSSSPDFENRFLINWLSKGGHSIASRTRISWGKYDKAYIHLPELSLETLTPSLLDRFDLVIADAEELSLLGAGERSVLRGKVREKGLGLIVKTDSAGREGTRLDGAGKVMYTKADTTYSQVLSGKERLYAAYWSRVLGKMAREAAPEETWRMEPDLPRVGEPVRVELQTNKGGLPQGDIGGRAVYLAQDAQLPFFWQGAFWPETAGWHIARSLQGDSCWWYVWARGADAPEAGQAEVGRAPKTEGRQRSDGEGHLRSGGTTSAAGGWFYAVFLLCVLFLWVERKWKG